MMKKFREIVAALKKTKGMLVLGHRGVRHSDVPENTMAAFQKAFETGADGIEIDVESTSDNQLVVVNRWFLKKHFSGFPWESGLHDIQDQGKRKGLLIPTFSEVCELVSTTPESILNVEIKSSHHGWCQTARQAISCLYDHGIENRVIISSFDMNTLITVKFYRPKLETAYLFRKEDRVLDIRDKRSFRYKVNGMINRTGIKAFLSAADTIHPEICLFDNQKRSCWQYNPLIKIKHVNAWTVDTIKDFEKAMINGADMIISDNPEKMVVYRNNHYPA